MNEPRALVVAAPVGMVAASAAPSTSGLQPVPSISEWNVGTYVAATDKELAGHVSIVHAYINSASENPGEPIAFPEVR